ncbi:VanW family protein [Nostocoides sp. Soil756]|jgi:vancomycin resistance protein YoaR|uniref:VanW family protein n=1 Tax=Nostocoides sp. Soil756 TaxID=1736399 RepID=UPI0006FAFEFE|nr:VanW family protein [Tetrasphaera sp. Soil756]KRE61146.1 hypothetical protein ASG78_12450 [Tetrasphaera sp. Soil756]
MTDLFEHARWEEPGWEERAPRPRHRLRTVLGVLLALGLVYLAAAWWLGERIPRGTTVAGVPVGGQDPEQAGATLARALERPDATRLTLTSPVGSARLDARTAGLSVDVAATVANLTGFTLAPAHLWRHLVGGTARPAVVRVDQAAFEKAVDGARADLDAAPKEGSLSLAGGKVAYVAPTPGAVTDLESTAAAVRRWWPAQDSVEVVATTTPPKVSASELERVRDEFAEVAVSAPVTIEAGDRSFRIPAADLAPAIVLTPAADGTITPRADDAALRAVVHKAALAARVDAPAVDALVTFSGLEPRVTPHVVGRTLDDAAVSREVWKALTSADHRTATIPTRQVQPGFTTDAATASLPTGVISTFTTKFPCCQARVKNIQKGASVVDGTYVLPGKQFSLNAVLGDTTTKESGYVQAGIIRYGRAAMSYGGGLSQVSTTVFNAAFFAGMRLDAWTPHSYWISRYPEGREATISYPNLHHKWTNTTQGGVLVKATTTATSITVTFYGQKTYDVTATKSARYDVTKPKVIVDDSPDCLPQNPVDGFTVDVGRIMKQGGKVVQRETFTTKYVPEDDVTCTNPKPAS